MELTARMEYGVLALAEMANHTEGTPLHAAEIAQRQGIPRPYLDQLLLALRRAGLVRSIRGPKGGHLLAKEPTEVSLRDVYQALEGDSGTRSGRRRDDSARREREDSGLNAAWAAAERAFLDALGQTTVADLAANLKRRRGTPMYYI